MHEGLIVTSSDANKRPLIGVITIICLTVAAVSAANGDWNTATTGAFVRVGLVMGAVWLAYPSIRHGQLWRRFSRGAIIFLVVLAIFARRMRYFLPLIAVGLVVFWFVRPKRRR